MGAHEYAGSRGKTTEQDQEYCGLGKDSAFVRTTHKSCLKTCFAVCIRMPLMESSASIKKHVWNEAEAFR